MKRVCKQCNGPLPVGAHANARYCGAECRREAEYAARRVPEVLLGNCRECGTVFNRRAPRGGPPLVFCSGDCRLKFDRDRKRVAQRERRAAAKAQASTERRSCKSCGTGLKSQLAVYCPACRKARAQEQNRLSGKRTREREREQRGKALAAYSFRERGIRASRADLERFITVTPIEKPLPSDPRAALLEALDRHPALRQAFAEHHGIQVGQA